MFKVPWPKRIMILVVLSVLVIAASTFFKEAVELEDAEQAYYSQWLRWGYDDQPPLYTWIQYVFNNVLGFNKVSFSLLRGLIFGSILLLLYHFAKNMHKDVQRATLTVFAMVLIPVFIDFTFRRLSHTSLLCFSVLASYFILERLLKKKTVKNYVLFGICIAFGLLSKYNYAFFLIALGVAGLFDGELRSIVFNRKMILTVLLATALVAPHFFWLLGPDENWRVIQKSVQVKTGNANDEFLFVLTPIIIFIGSLVSLLILLLLFSSILVLFKKVEVKRLEWNWFNKLLIAQISVLLLFFILVKAQKVEVRWLLPLFLPFMVLWIKAFRFKNIAIANKYGFMTIVVIMGLQLLRTPVEKMFGIPSSVHFGFVPISNILHNKYMDKQWVLPDVTYAGNIKLLNPKRLIFSDDDFSLKTKDTSKDKVIVVKGRFHKNSDKPTDSVLGFGMERDTLFFVPGLRTIE